MQRTSLADLVDMRAAESTFKRLLDTLELQAKEIDQLKGSVVALVLENTMQSSWNHDVKSVQASLMLRMDAVEAAIRLPNVRNASLGSIVAANYKEIVSMREKLQHKIEAPVVDDVCRRVETKLSTAFETLRKECVNLELVSSLHMDQDALHAKLVTVQAQLDSKMDKTEATRVEAVATKLHAFIPRCADIERSLQQLDEKLAASNATCRQNEQHAAVDTSLLRQLVTEQQQGLATLRSEASTTRGAIDAAIQKCKRNIDLCHNKLQSAQKAHDDFTLTTRSSLRELNQTLNRNEQALRNELGLKVGFAEWDAHRSETEALLQTKAPLSELVATKKTVDSLDDWSTRCDAHVQLSLRFVDWFFERGEAYEHNLQLMEAQLKQLSLRQVSREPFDGRVRFA